MTRRTAMAVGGIGLVVVAGLAVIAVGTGLVSIPAGRATPSFAAGPPQFELAATAAGLDHTYGGDPRFFVGGGLAAFDCDGDLRPDLYLAGGAGPAALFRNASDPGRLRFDRLADPATDLADVTGTYPIDIDGDGTTDLAVLRAGENVLLRGLGDCRFERANERWGFDGGSARTMAFSATWEGAATLPTLAIGDYIALDGIGTPQPPCPDGSLVRPAGSGGAGYAAPLPLRPGLCPLSMLFSDWDRSGRRDLRVSNDRQYDADAHEQLWRMEAGQPPVAYTGADGWVRMQIWGMGIASQDLTGDGLPEIYLTSQGDNKLQTLTTGPQQPMYRDIAVRRGVNAAQPIAGGEALPSTAWHPEFDDVNDDGFLDLYVTKGNVSEQVGYATRDPSELLLGQPDGTFSDATAAAGVLDFARGRGAALVDLDLDGWLDIVEVNLDAPVEVWHNRGTGDPGIDRGAHWLAIDVTQDGPNRAAVGAWLTIRIGELTIEREITIGGGHISGQLGPTHVGLGPATGAEVRVTWPDGEEGAWMSIEADQIVRIERGAPDPVVLAP